MNLTVAAKKKKLTQRERSEISQDKLISATIDCLIESGYSATSTQEICNRAGLSKGGLFRQFASRTELMIATAQRIYRSLLERFEQQFVAAGSSLEPIQMGVRLVRANFSRIEFQAAMELQMAARTDELLAKNMRPVVEESNAAVLRLAERLFPEAAKRNSRFSAVVHTVILMLQGEVFAATIYEDKQLADARLKFIEDMVRLEFAPDVLLRDGK